MDDELILEVGQVNAYIKEMLDVDVLLNGGWRGYAQMRDVSEQCLAAAVPPRKWDDGPGGGAHQRLSSGWSISAVLRFHAARRSRRSGAGL